MRLFVLILAACLALQFFLPWWIIAPVAFGLAFWQSASGREAFLAGFGAIFLLWLAVAGLASFRNDGLLAARIAELLLVKYPVVLLVATALVGGLVGGLASWTGFLWKQASSRQTTRRRSAA